MRLKKTICTLLMAIVCFVAPAQQEKAPINSGISFGFQLGQYQQDFGYGLHITSPYFLYQSVAVRVRGNMAFHQHVLNNETTWSPYGNLSLGIIGVGGTIGNSMRLYGEGGMMLLLPNSAFSAASTELGGYGLFGFEFFMDPHLNYFIEIGGAGTGATADKLPNGPIYSNGLLIQVGFRIQL